MSVRLSLLAILAQGSCYGYQLRSELDWRTGGTGPINVGQIYNTLDRLERDKLIRKTGDNNTYEITHAGRDAVADWFGSASPPAELPTKLALAATLPGVDIAAMLRIQRAASDPAGTEHREPGTGTQLAAAVITVATVVAVNGERELLDRVEALLALGIPPTPLSSEMPRRGRPVKRAG